MYKFTIKGETPEQLEENIKQFVRSREIITRVPVKINHVIEEHAKLEQDAKVMYPDPIQNTHPEINFPKEPVLKDTHNYAPPLNDLKVAIPAQPALVTQEHVAKEETVDNRERIDGYVVSNGQVWVPVEGRSSAFRGVPVEEYMAKKNAQAAQQVQAGPNMGDLDSKGMPYDLRIHAATRSTVRDGSWKYKRGVDDTLIAQVEAQNKAMMAGSISTSTQPAIPAAPVSPFPVEQPVMQPVPVAPIQPAVVQPITPVATQVAQTVETVQPQYNNVQIPQGNSNAYTLDTFKTHLIPTILPNLIEAGKIDQNYIQQLKQSFGVKELWDMTDAHMNTLFDHFAHYGLITKLG